MAVLQDDEVYIVGDGDLPVGYPRCNRYDRDVLLRYMTLALGDICDLTKFMSFFL